MFSTDRFWGTISYVLAAFCGMLLVGCRLPKREHFFLRAVLSCIGICILRYIVLVYGFEQMHFRNEFLRLLGLSTGNLLVVGLCFLSLGVCFRANVWAMLFCSTAGYSLQYISRKIYDLLALALPSLSKPMETLLVLLITALIYIPVWLFYFRKANYVGMFQKHKLQIVIAVIFVIFTIYINMFADMASMNVEDPRIRMYQHIYATAMVLAVFIMECSILAEKNLRSERDELKRMIEQQRENYLQEKKNIDLVNIRCHDIRHQLREMKDGIDPEAMQRITDAIDIYDSRMETGNEAISVVLAKYSLYCAKHHIRLSCLVDGEKLNFIPAHELYALFGNAVENAIHAVRQLEKEKRVISITEKTVGNLMTLSFVNYFSGELDFEDGLPTNREENHGFGVKSIQMIAQEYGGRMSVQTRGDMFILNIFFPLPLSAGN